MVESIITFFGLVNILLGVKIYWDKLQKDSGRIINHTMSFAINSVIVSTIGVLCFGWSAGGWIIAAAGYWWLMFDLVFAKINWGKWVFYGTSSWLDIQLSKLGRFHLVPKILLLAFGIYLIIVI